MGSPGRYLYTDLRMAELLVDGHRHHGMNFPNRIFLCFTSSVGMIRRRVIDIEKGPACDRDCMCLAHFEPLRFLETERKALRCPTENSLSKLAPCGTDRNFGTNSSGFVAFGVFEHKRNVTIVFNFYAVEAASDVIPFLFSCDSGIRLGRQRHIGPWSFPLVDLRWYSCLNSRLVQRHRRRIGFDWPATTDLLALTLARRHERRGIRCHRFCERRANNEGRHQSGK
jgi:hypothetical protein